MWLGELCQRVFSESFNLFEKKKINEKAARIYCCENMIFNIIELARKNEFSGE